MTDEERQKYFELLRERQTTAKAALLGIEQTRGFITTLEETFINNEWVPDDIKEAAVVLVFRCRKYTDALEKQVKELL